MVFRGEVIVENDSEVADMWRERVVDDKAEVMSGFGDIFGTSDYHVWVITVYF